MSTVISSKGVNGMLGTKMFSVARSSIGVGLVFVALSFAYAPAARPRHRPNSSRRWATARSIQWATGV